MTTTGWRLWRTTYDDSGKRHLVPPLTSQAGPETERLRGGPFKPPLWINDRTAAAQCHKCSSPPAHDHGCGIYFYPDIETFSDLLRGCANNPNDPILPADRTVATYGRTLGFVLPDPFETLASDAMRCTAYEIRAVWTIAQLTQGGGHSA